MPLISLRQLLDHAAEHGYGVPAFNVNNMEIVQGIMRAAARAEAPVILQASRGARAYAGDAMLRHLIAGAAETYPDVPICVHQDHGNAPATCLSAIANGFTSVMMDGSLKDDAKTPADYDYNVAVTRRVVEMAHMVGVSVEGELGCLGSLETGAGDKEDGHGFDGTLARDQLLTDPDQAMDFVLRTGVDALAVAIGTSHGAYKFSRKPDGAILAMDVIQAIHERMPDLHMVMHGSSTVPQPLLDIINAHGGAIPPTWGVPVAEIQAGITLGVRKVNIDTDLRLAITGQVRTVLTQKPAEFDPRSYLKPAVTAVEAVCYERLEAFGAAGMAGRLKPLPLADMARRYAAGALAPRVATPHAA